MSFSQIHIDKRVSKELSTLSKKSIVLDLGTSKRFAKELASFEKELNKTNYFALGYNPDLSYGEEKCDVNGDVTQLPFSNNCADLVFCIEVLEHVANPFNAVEELFRVTRKSGTVILTTPFLLPYHGKSKETNNYSHETYPDFWRFTFQGLQHLFNNFSEVEVIPFTNTYEYFLNRLLKFDTLPILSSSLIQSRIYNKQAHKPGVTTHRHMVVAKK